MKNPISYLQSLTKKKIKKPKKPKKPQLMDPIQLQNKAFSDCCYLVRQSVFKDAGSLGNIENKIVMVGDSITNFCEWREFFPDVNIFNRGICGDTITGVKLRFSEIAKLQPAKIFLMIGINNFSLCFSLEETKLLYNEMLQEIRKLLPDVQLYLQSVLPVRNGANVHIADNTNIIALNNYINEISALYNAHFINLYDAFLDATGQMNTELAVDGIHLNGKGYRLWCNQITPYTLLVE